MLYGMDLFTGIGGITLALQDYVEPLCYCENDTYAQSTLLQRMSEGNLPKAPIWDDVSTLQVEGFPQVDIIYGGFPCQDISIAGRQKGLGGKRSGLVFEIFRLVDETKAPFVFLENVPNIRTKGAERISKELAERGYDCRWCMLSAGDVGARHKRERWFLLAHTKCEGLHEGHQHKEGSVAGYSRVKQDYWAVEPELGRVALGVSHRIHRIKALGNSVVPLQVREAFKMLMGIKDG